MRGRVEWFNNIEGYGVVDADDCDREIRVEFGEIESEAFPSLEAGDRIEFELERKPDGLYARHVERTSSAGSERPAESSPGDAAGSAGAPGDEQTRQ